MNDASDIYIGPILTDIGRLRREAVRRRKPFDEKAIAPEVIPVLEAEGWQVDRQLKRVTKVRREKDAFRRPGLLGRVLMNNTNYELGPLCGRTDKVIS